MTKAEAETLRKRNPAMLEIGNRVRVMTQTHKEYLSEGLIQEFFSVTVDDDKKPRCSIKIDRPGDPRNGKFIFVSLPNLKRV